MSNAKRGFVFYFDLCPMVDALPPDQRGWLLSALCTYADRVWRDLTVTPQEVSQLYPQLSQQSLMAFRFLACVILRDTQKWLSQREARLQRRQQQGRGPASPVSPHGGSSAALERSREDTQRLQKLVERLRLENEESGEAQLQPASGTACVPGSPETPTPPAGW